MSCISKDNIYQEHPQNPEFIRKKKDSSAKVKMMSKYDVLRLTLLALFKSHDSYPRGMYTAVNYWKLFI